MIAAILTASTHEVENLNQSAPYSGRTLTRLLVRSRVNGLFHRHTMRLFETRQQSTSIKASGASDLSSGRVFATGIRHRE